MKTPESSQAPDLILMVSWMSVYCEKFLFAIVIATKERQSKNDRSTSQLTLTMLA